MRRRNPPKFDRKPDFIGQAKFRAKNRELGDPVECCFFLPISETDKIWMLIRAARESLVQFCWKFACELRQKDHVLIAEEVYHSGWTNWDWRNGAENTLIGEVTILRLTQGNPEESAISTVQFSITASALLRSADVLNTENGEVLLRQVARKGPECRVTPQIGFRFQSSYRLGSDNKVESRVVCELIHVNEMLYSDRVTAALDDVLLIASLAEGRSIRWTEWKITYENKSSSNYFRRNFSPPRKEETDIDETLVALPDIEDFLNQAVTALRAFGHGDALRQAIQFAISGHGTSIVHSYIILFAGVETLLNAFRSEQNLETIIAEKKDWFVLRKQLASAFGNSDIVLSLRPERRSMLQNKLSELNRVSFSDAFKLMCSLNGIDLSDLWPMVDDKDVSLTSLRNKIVHGHVFPKTEQWFRMVSAKFHLLWSLERIILKSLRWPIEKTRVSSRRLCGMTLYSEWRVDRQFFANLKKQTTG